jgi:hypothetical protein
LPIVAYQTGTAPARGVAGKWWNGMDWTAVASPNLPANDVVAFRAALAADGTPIVALAQRESTSTAQTAQELVVRRLAPVTLSVVVNGQVNSDRVDTGAAHARCRCRRTLRSRLTPLHLPASACSPGTVVTR